MAVQITNLALSTLLLSVVCFEVNAVGLSSCGACSCGDQKGKKYISDNSCRNKLLIDMADQGLSFIETDAFRHMASTQILGLNNNLIFGLNPNVFKPLSSLVTLQLANNKLSSLPNGIFDHNPNLKNVDLMNNRLTTLPQGIFKNQANLEILSLKMNPIRVLPAKAFNGLGVLKRLYLDHLPLSQAPQSNVFKSLVSLQILSLHNCSLTTLPMGIFDSLTELIQLDLGGNKQLRGLSPKMLTNNIKLTKGLRASSWTFTLDSLWQQCGITNTRDWRYKMVLDFRTQLKMAHFGDRVLSRCNGGSLLCLPGNSISFACNCPQGHVHDGIKCVLTGTTQCSPKPFPRGYHCDMYPACVANTSISAPMRITGQCTCPPKTILVPNPCPNGSGRICDAAQGQCMDQMTSCNRPKTHICVCPAEAKQLSCIPRGACSTGPLKARYPRAFGRKPYLRNGVSFQGSCSSTPGSVEFKCNNGQMSVVEKCYCLPDSASRLYPAALNGVTLMKHGESFQRPCSKFGYTRVTCSNGRITVNSQCICHTWFVARRFRNSFRGIPTMEFGQTITRTCPRTGHGSIHFSCISGRIITREDCGCVPGALQSYFPSAFLKPSPVTVMKNNQVIQNTCPHGGTIAFTCNNGNINIANKCNRIKCGTNNLVRMTSDNITRMNAARACSMVGGSLPDYNSLHNECSSRIGSRGGNLLWMQNTHLAKTLFGFTRYGPRDRRTQLRTIYYRYPANSRVIVFEGVDHVGYVCKFKLEQFPCYGKFFFLAPTHFADGRFAIRNYNEAKQECSERGLSLPGYKDAACTRIFLRKVSNGHRWSAWLHNHAVGGAYFAVDTQHLFTFGGVSPLSTTICTTL